MSQMAFHEKNQNNNFYWLQSREIIHLVASVHPFVIALMAEPFGLWPLPIQRICQCVCNQGAYAETSCGHSRLAFNLVSRSTSGHRYHHHTGAVKSKFWAVAVTQWVQLMIMATFLLIRSTLPASVHYPAICHKTDTIIMQVQWSLNFGQ